uniref:Uncharacterized LOC100184195 n=1 Tax=Ciona intestinalis TaxID=7719 RepID=F6UQJ3_CIOIN
MEKTKVFYVVTSLSTLIALIFLFGLLTSFYYQNMKINEEIERKVAETNCMACCGKNSERCKKMQCETNLCSNDQDSGKSHLYNEHELHKFIRGHAANEYEDAIKVANQVITSRAKGQSLATRIEKALSTTNEHRPYLHMWNKDSHQNGCKFYK